MQPRPAPEMARKSKGVFPSLGAPKKKNLQKNPRFPTDTNSWENPISKSSWVFKYLSNQLSNSKGIQSIIFQLSRGITSPLTWRRVGNNHLPTPKMKGKKCFIISRLLLRTCGPKRFQERITYWNHQTAMQRISQKNATQNPYVQPAISEKNPSFKHKKLYTLPETNSEFTPEIWFRSFPFSSPKEASSSVARCLFRKKNLWNIPIHWFQRHQWEYHEIVFLG